MDGASASGVHVKPPLRTKSVGTKVSEAEFALLEERARGAGMRLAEWVREALLAAPVEPVAGSGVDSRVQNTSYDQAKRLTALFDNFNSVNVDLASNFGYYPNGAVEDVYLGNSNSSQTHQHTTLNSRLQVTGRSAQVHSTDGSPTLLTLGFNYPSSPSNNGNISSESITTNGGMGSSGINVTQSFGYDAFNRILSMSETSGLSQSYGYDAYGNRALTGGYAPSPYLTPTSTSQFTGNRWLGSGSSTAGYDASGNQTQNTNGGNVFTFDAENRMATSNIGNMGVTSYVYDGEGRRIEKTSSTFTSYYVYDSSGDPVAEYTTETQPVYGTLYVTPDHLGSTRLLTNGNGDVVRRYDYLPFGEEIPSGSYSRGNDYGGNQYPNAGGSSFPGDAASHKFTGKERDAESGLDYFGARYYASNMGRWMSPDPKAPNLKHLFNPQKWNKYNYVLNNPLSNVDPDGQEEITITYRTFIAPASIHYAGSTYAGDNRGFSTAANASSRSTITVRIETDPSIRPGNPIISQTSSAGQSRTLDANGNTVKAATATVGLPTATGTRDANGNAVINIQQDEKNPLSPAGSSTLGQMLTPGITANLNVSVTPDASTMQVNGSAASFPSSELNVTTPTGTTPLIQFTPAPGATPSTLFKPDRPVQACQGTGCPK